MFSKKSIAQLEKCRHESADIIYDVYQIKNLFLLTIIGKRAKHIIVTGSIDKRVVLIIGVENILISINNPIQSILANNPIENISSNYFLNEFICNIRISEEHIWQIISPKILLISLCHPENFPMPRFSLGISDIAEEIRKNWCGEVFLEDMQLGINVHEILKLIEEKKYDVIGFSVTFGQQDILDALLEKIFAWKEYKPFIIVGGSLASLNHKSILERYPSIMVALGEGEKTLTEAIQHWRGNRAIDTINDIAFCDIDGNIKHNKAHKSEYFFAPALDLLDKTLECNGVMQLETSRGCTNACSFCPRNHKGKWRGMHPTILDTTMPHIEKVYNKHPNIAKKIFLVDEEFIGRHTATNIERVVKIAETLNKYGFSFETSSRIDQVYNSRHDTEWHIHRMLLFKYLVEKGLERVLFGIESGVDSVLARFNKKTTREQNIYAIRILSACNIPVRYTYITFDPLMTIDELIETYNFQGRTDLLMRPLSSVSEEDIFNLVHDEKALAPLMQNEPLYKEIPYMLVSLEGLLTSKYLAIASQLSLQGKEIISMGKQEIHYLNPKIGMLSHASQLWIDRNFSLDYSLKSIAKIANKKNRKTLYKLRSILKDYAYILLGKMLYVVSGNNSVLNTLSLDERTDIQQLRQRWTDDLNASDNIHNKILLDILENQNSALGERFKKVLSELKTELEPQFFGMINNEFRRWQAKKTWKIINEF